MIYVLLAFVIILQFLTLYAFSKVGKALSGLGNVFQVFESEKK